MDRISKEVMPYWKIICGIKETYNLLNLKGNLYQNKFSQLKQYFVKGYAMKGEIVFLNYYNFITFTKFKIAYIQILILRTSIEFRLTV